MSFLITLGIILVVIFFVVVFAISVVTALWQAMHDLLTRFFTWIFRSGYAIIGLIIFFIICFKLGHG